MGSCPTCSHICFYFCDDHRVLIELNILEKRLFRRIAHTLICSMALVRFFSAVISMPNLLIQNLNRRTVCILMQGFCVKKLLSETSVQRTHPDRWEINFSQSPRWRTCSLANDMMVVRCTNVRFRSSLNSSTLQRAGGDQRTPKRTLATSTLPAPSAVCTVHTALQPARIPATTPSPRARLRSPHCWLAQNAPASPCRLASTCCPFRAPHVARS